MPRPLGSKNKTPEQLRVEAKRLLEIAKIKEKLKKLS